MYGVCSRFVFVRMVCLNVFVWCVCAWMCDVVRSVACVLFFSVCVSCVTFCAMLYGLRVRVCLCLCVFFYVSM